MSCPQCTSPTESEEPVARAEDIKQERDEQEQDQEEDRAPSPADQSASYKSVSSMTTATSPPPPQETEGQRSGDAAPDEPESTDLGARLICAICDGVVESDVALAAHIQELGINHLSGAEDVDGFACRVCRRVFASADLLDR